MRRSYHLTAFVLSVFILLLITSCLQANEIKELGKELRKKTSLLFNSEDLLTEEDLIPESDKGKSFDPQKQSPTPLSQEITQMAAVGRTIESIDESELFLQQSRQITTDPTSCDTGLQSINLPTPSQNIIFHTCEESRSRVISIEQKKEIKILPAIKETKKVCLGHIHVFYAKFPTENSAEKKKKEIKNNIGNNIELIEIKINGQALPTSFKHKNPDILGAIEANKIHTLKLQCFNYKTEETIVQPQQETSTWKTSSPDLLEYAQKAEHCSLAGISHSHESSRTLIFRCEKGEDSKCQKIRSQGGILVDKECIETDPEEECSTYRKTFEIRQQTSLPNEYRLEENALVPLEDFETVSEIDPDFGEAVSRLAAISEIPGNIEENTNLMEAEVFPGTLMKCKRGCSSDYLYDCCGDPKGWLLGKGASCTKDEEKLWHNRQDKKCHYIGSRDLTFGLEKEQVYICYPNILSRIIQEEGRNQLGIHWGTAEKPKNKGLKLSDLLEVDFEKIDFSDFEVEMKRSIDTDAIQKKIQSSVDSMSPKGAQLQTDALLREDKKKCAS